MWIMEKLKTLLIANRGEIAVRRFVARGMMTSDAIDTYIVLT